MVTNCAAGRSVACHLVTLVFTFFREIINRFNIPYQSINMRGYHIRDRMEARGVFATTTSELQQKAFPTLSQGRSNNASYKDMIKSLLDKQSQAVKFPSKAAFFTHCWTPEGLEYFDSLTGFVQDYSRMSNAESFFETREALAYFDREFSRPNKGISALIQALKNSAIKHGLKIYKNEEVKVIDEVKKNSYILKTRKFQVTANKVVLAVPAHALEKIQGSLTEKIKNNHTFKSVGFAVAFKGFALYEKAWWESNSTGSRKLRDEQEFLSNSDCLGLTFPYR